MRYLAVSNARSRLAELVDSAERTIITRNGEPAAILMTIDDYRAMQAMNRLTRDPERLRRILDDHEKVQRGELESFPELDLDRLRSEKNPEPAR